MVQNRYPKHVIMRVIRWSVTAILTLVMLAGCPEPKPLTRDADVIVIGAGIGGWGVGRRARVVRALPDHRQVRRRA